MNLTYPEIDLHISVKIGKDIQGQNERPQPKTLKKATPHVFDKSRG